LLEWGGISNLRWSRTDHLVAEAQQIQGATEAAVRLKTISKSRHRQLR
jgi:hypothetical protein